MRLTTVVGMGICLLLMPALTQATVVIQDSFAAPGSGSDTTGRAIGNMLMSTYTEVGDVQWNSGYADYVFAGGPGDYYAAGSATRKANVPYVVTQDAIVSVSYNFNGQADSNFAGVWFNHQALTQPYGADVQTVYASQRRLVRARGLFDGGQR